MAIRNVTEHVEATRRQVEGVTVEQLQRAMADGGDLLVVDVREIGELVDRGTIPGARHVPRGMLEFWADPASPYNRDFFGEHRRTVLFCAGGLRSVYATKTLADMGFTNVASLDGGFGAWTAAGADVEDVASTSKWVRRASKDR